MKVVPIPSRVASRLVVAHHYLHRRPPISYAFGLVDGGMVQGVVTFGTPPSRHLQMSACPSDPSRTIELNRLWVSDSLPGNTESWFVSRALKLMPPRIVVSYADTAHGHVGYIYRALNFNYAGWTDMERKTPRYDYIPADPTTHTRDAFRNGYVEKRRRLPKVKYWTTTGTRRDRARLATLCGWPVLDWRETPPPTDVPNAATRPSAVSQLDRSDECTDGFAVGSDADSSERTPGQSDTPGAATASGGSTRTRARHRKEGR